MPNGIDVLVPSSFRRRVPVAEGVTAAATHGSAGQARRSTCGSRACDATVRDRRVIRRLRENVFRPAGMTSTDSVPEDENVPDRAVAYPFRQRVGAGDGDPPVPGARRQAAATPPSATCSASPKHCRTARCSRRSCSPTRPAPRAKSSTATASTSATTRRHTSATAPRRRE